MSDVACICSAPIVAEARLRGLDAHALIEGLGLSLDIVENPHRRIPWNTFTEFARRAAKMLGPDVLQDLAAEATVASTPGPLRRLLPHLRDSRTLFALAPRWWGPWVFRGSRGTCEPLADGRMREIVWILPEFGTCPEFLEGLQGTLRAMPRLLGQSDALVSVDQDGREAEFIITPPPRRSGWRRPRDPRSEAVRPGQGTPRPGASIWGRRRERARAERELESFGFAREHLLDRARTIDRLNRELDERSKSLAAIDRLGEILVQTDPANHGMLRQAIVDLVVREVAAEGVRLIPRGRDQSLSSDGVTAGRVTASPERCVVLRVGDREVGRLEVFGRLARPAQQRLDAITPWIAFSLECGGSKSLTAHLIALLSEEVRDWDRMEQRLAGLHVEKPKGGPLN